MGILSWVVLGLLAGLIAQAIMPGKVKGGLLVTILLGIVGAFVGGFVGSLLGLGGVAEFSIRTLAIAVGGALLVLFLWGRYGK